MGNGTSTFPYQINSTKDFLAICLLFGEIKNAYIDVNCDIILNEEKFDIDGKPSRGDGIVYKWINLHPYTSLNSCYLNFNGNKIIGLYQDSPSYCGMFYSWSGIRQKEIKNCCFENVFIRGSSASILGKDIGIIENCIAQSGYIVSLYDKSESCVFASYATSIINCKNYINVYGEAQYSISSFSCNVREEVRNCINYGDMKVGKCSTGGIVKSGKIITDCINYGNITMSTAHAVAGIASSACKVVRCENYGDLVSSSSRSAILIAADYQTVDILYCKNFGSLGDSSQQADGVISFIPNYNSEGQIINIYGCEMNFNINGRLVSLAKSWINKVAEINVKNCVLNFDNVTTTSGAALIYNFSTHLNPDVVIMNVENVIVNVTSDKIEKVSLTNHKKLTTFKNIIIMIKNKNVEYNSYYGSSFFGFYMDLKTGKIGLKVLSGRGFYQGRVSEELLTTKGFEKKVL